MLISELKFVQVHILTVILYHVPLGLPHSLENGDSATTATLHQRAAHDRVAGQPCPPGGGAESRRLGRRPSAEYGNVPSTASGDISGFLHFAGTRHGRPTRCPRPIGGPAVAPRSWGRAQTPRLPPFRRVRQRTVRR